MLALLSSEFRELRRHRIPKYLPVSECLEERGSTFSLGRTIADFVFSGTLGRGFVTI